ncbi:MAG: ATP-binding protein, partial [Myxococcota bacterium]|nr:ATP-binding protein [Myxococcota bacterium]
AVLEGMDNAVLALDADNMVILANSATRSIFHLDEDPTGRPLSEVISAPEIMQLVREEGAEDEGVVEFSLEDPHRVVLTRLTRGPGGAILVVHDLTRLRKLETVRRDFIANVSHELRTPIAVIQANAETLLDGALHEPEQAGRFVEGVLRNARRLSQIISDLLDLTRIESGKYEVEFEEIALRRLVERSCTMLESRALARNITLHVSIPEDALVVADCKALDHILSNYIDNAIKYGPEEGTVTVSTSAGEGTWRVEVADQGAGIDSRHHERLFERFYRVDKGRSRYMGGTGLGLAIVKHLAVAMGGRVGMRSGAQGGSVFWVELPLRDEEGGMLA